MKVSISFSIFLDLSISKEDAAMSMENMRLPYILLVVIRKKESTIIQSMIITRSVLLYDKRRFKHKKSEFAMK